MADPGWINASGGTPAYTAAETRQLMALALQYNGRTLGARAGVRPGGNALNTELSGTTITVRAGVACVDPALTTAQGPYWVPLPADETHTLTAAHATLPRKDITILRVYDHDEDSSGQRKAQSEYLTGTAAASPAEPAVPAGAFRLATIDVPASGGGSPTVTINHPFTAAAGGITVVRTQTERDALAGYDGTACYRRDRDWIEAYDGTAWRVHGVAACTSTTDRDAAVTNPATGALATTTDTGTLWQRDASAWRALPRGIIARHRRTTSSTTTTTTTQTNAQGVCWLAATVKTGHLYRIGSPNVGVYTLAAGRARIQHTYTTDGSTPTAASTLLATSDESETTVGNKVFNRDLHTLYIPGTDHTIKVLLSIWNDVIAGTAGTFATSTWPTEIIIEHIGLDPGSTGTNI